MTDSPTRTGAASVTVTAAPSTPAAPVPAMVRASPSAGAAVTVKALPAGAEPASSASPNVTVSVSLLFRRLSDQRFPGLFRAMGTRIFHGVP